MSKPRDGSPLIEAVRAFDAELERFAKAATSACRRSLDSKRELEKAAESVNEAADAEKAMQVRAQELVVALKAAEADQQARAEALRARTEEIQARSNAYDALADRYRQLGAAGGQLADAAQKLRSDTSADQPAPAKAELLSGIADLERRVSELRTAARALAEDARADKFEDLAGEAHSIEQTLSALRNKLLLAQKAASMAPPVGDA
jgi:chromosome segregation ATPase